MGCSCCGLCTGAEIGSTPCLPADVQILDFCKVENFPAVQPRPSAFVGSLHQLLGLEVPSLPCGAWSCPLHQKIVEYDVAAAVAAVVGLVSLYLIRVAAHWAIDTKKQQLEQWRASLLESYEHSE